MPMSATPSWAKTAPSMYSTIECTMLCGWTTTCTWSGRTSKSQRASMISSPLFISVAESTVIFAPIFQVGCRRASAIVASASFSFGHSRNGPPDAVRMIRWTSLRLCPARHWKIALCSESTGRSGTLWSRAAAVIKAPAITRVSLLAGAMGEPGDPELVGERRDDLERTEADRPGGAEQRERPHGSAHVPRVVEQRGRVEEQAVQAVEEAAVARDHPARVLRVGAPLQDGLGQVAALADEPEERAGRQADPDRAPGQEPPHAEPARQHRDPELGDRHL